MTELVKTLNWEIIETPNYYNYNDTTNPSGTKSLVRSDNGNLLNTVNDKFVPTKNEQLQKIVTNISAISDFEFKGFYEFKGGQKILGYFQNPDPNCNILGHKMQEYMTIGTGCDGATPMFFGTSSMLIRCTNQFSKVLKQNIVKHTSNHEIRVSELAKQYEQFLISKKLMYQQIERFADIEVNDRLTEDLIKTILCVEGEEFSTQQKKKQEAILECCEYEMAELGSNGFGLFNGITKYTTHNEKLTKKENVFGNYFGQQNKINQTAFNFINKLN